MAEYARGVLDDIRLRYLRGGSGHAAVRSMPRRTQNLWRVSQGSNAAILKKIHRGGTHTKAQLGNQLDYLFSKATAVFGNMVDHDPDARSLTGEQREEIAAGWEDGWRGDPKNGHTTHLLLSFPADVAPKRALKVAETWAAEMFQSGAHANDEWSYVAALHTDRAHPHVHVVVNNRGIANGTWFYMAKDHDFELLSMKERMVEIAAEGGMYLNSSSRLDRGKLTYGPSRAEIENARRDNRAVFEKPLQGRALRDAVEYIRQNIETLHQLTDYARQWGDDGAAMKMEHAAEVLERGGVISTFKDETMEAAQVKTKGDFVRYFENWLDQTERDINRLPVSEQSESRREFYKIAGDIARDLGDKRGAELMQQGAKTTLYQTSLQDDGVSRGEHTRPLNSDAVAELKQRVSDQANAAGLDPHQISERMQRGAANAWEERDWIRKDVIAVADARNLDLERPEGRTKAAEMVDRFYDAVGKVLTATLEHRATNDRVTRALGAMEDSLRETGQVQFRSDEDARRFAGDLRERYGDNIMERLASGDDRALAADFADQRQRRQIAMAVVAAAERHEGMGLTLNQAREAKEALVEQERPQQERGRDRER